MALDVGDKTSVLFDGLSGFWQTFFRDAPDIIAYYQAAELYLGQVYLDLMAAVLNIGAIDTPIFNKEAWKLFTVLETELNFKSGATANEDRYMYDMPGDVVSVDFLQNTIFQPEVLLERGVEFFVEENDGFIRFADDPFREYQDANGDWLPTPGIAWRSVPVQVGNLLRNIAYTIYDTPSPDAIYDDGIRRGDILRVLAQKGAEIVSGAAGSIVKIPGGFMFYGTGVGQLEVGDVVHVSGHDGGAGHADDAYRDFYVIKTVYKNPSFPNQVSLEPLSVHNSGPAGSTANLEWIGYRAIYFEGYRDYEVDYIDGLNLVGGADNPYSLDFSLPLVYSVVREPPQPAVLGAVLNQVTHAGPYPVEPPTLPYGGGYTPANPPPAYITDLGYRNLDHGSVVVYAVKVDGTGDQVEEGADYTVDYLRGRIIQRTYWRANSAGRVNFTYKDEVFLSGAGEVEAQTTGSVRQLSYWVPEVIVDRFTLFYNYGSMLNRFENSSESYKNFLMGVMYLYTTGPILQRIEAALNVAGGYPVIKSDGEVLQGYGSGQEGAGVLASITGGVDTVTLDVSEYQLSTADVGGWIFFFNPANDSNKGSFKILTVDVATNTATLETTYGLVTESGVNWELTRYNIQTVTTDRRTYQYAYGVPLRDDLKDPANFGRLSFVAFEPLTTGFLVTDYLEDPHWWHDSFIPEVLWPAGSADSQMDRRTRRWAAARLYEHVVGANDLAAIGDPGLFIGADQQGIVLEPNDNSGGIGVGDSVSTHRNNVAFFLFDQYLKMQMFYIEISPLLELDLQFKIDLEEIILIAKPSYTYPAVERNDLFIDGVVLTDVFSLPLISFDFSQAGEPNSIQLANNELVVGDPEFPWNIGDFFTYEEVAGPVTGPHPNPIPPGYIFDIAADLSAGQSLLVLSIALLRTLDGKVAVEGRDYTVNWLVEKPPLTPNPLAWRVTMLTECETGGPPVAFSAKVVNLVQGAYDTTLGHTPLTVGAGNPWYIRHTALDPESATFIAEWEALRTEFVDRPIQLTVIDSGGSYTYP